MASYQVPVSVLSFIPSGLQAGVQNWTNTTDLYTYLANAMTSGEDLYAPAGLYNFNGDLPALSLGCNLTGAGSGGYLFQGSTATGRSQTIFQRMDAGGSTGSVLTLGDGCTVNNLLVIPHNWSAMAFDAVAYPTGSGNCQWGINMGVGATATNCVAKGFAQHGFHLKTTSKLITCYGFQNLCAFGVDPGGATDGSLVDCVAASNLWGADLRDNFWKVLGGRFEWNAFQGIAAGGESCISGATFDRNGEAGLWLVSGSWGHVISGCYFARNGAGGDGTSGRWGYSTPGTPSYYAVPAGQSCHIEVDYEHAATVSGCRFRAGQDDAGGGSFSPQFVYGSAGVSSGATPVPGGLNTAANTGDRYTHAVLGYNPNYGGVTGAGKPGGGSDTLMANALNALT